MAVLRRAAVLILLLACFLVAGGGSARPDARMPDGTVDHRASRWIADRAEELGVPGVAWAIVSAERTEVAGTYGTQPGGAAVTTSTPHVWGSVSKPITASLVVLLADEGVLGLDDPVVEHLPDFATTDEATQRATVRDLLTHTSGLPTGLELLDDAGAERRPHDVVALLRDVEPVADPGEGHHYSGLGYVVLAAVVEAATGSSFEDALTARGLPAGDTDEVTGHRYVAGQPVAWRTDVDHASAAAGYLTGSIQDLAAFARTQLPGGPVLNDAQRARLHAAAVETGPDATYGLGWRVSQPPGTSQSMVWHGGAAPGFTSAVVLVPGTDLAVVLLANVYGPFHDAALVGMAGGLAAIVAGEQPTSTGVDVTYPVGLAVLITLGVVLVVLALLSWRRIRRPRAVPGRRRGLLGTVATATPGAVAVVGLLAVPGLLGVRLTQLTLWAPDLAWLVWTELLLALLVCLLAPVTLWRGRRARATAGLHLLDEARTG